MLPLHSHIQDGRNCTARNFDLVGPIPRKLGCNTAPHWPDTYIVDVRICSGYWLAYFFLHFSK